MTRRTEPDYRALESDAMPTAHTSDAAMADDKAAARAYLARRNALDLVDVLGLGEGP